MSNHNYIKGLFIILLMSTGCRQRPDYPAATELIATGGHYPTFSFGSSGNAGSSGENLQEKSDDNLNELYPTPTPSTATFHTRPIPTPEATPAHAAPFRCGDVIIGDPIKNEQEQKYNCDSETGHAIFTKKIEFQNQLMKFADLLTLISLKREQKEHESQLREIPKEYFTLPSVDDLERPELSQMKTTVAEVKQKMGLLEKIKINTHGLWLGSDAGKDREAQELLVLIQEYENLKIGSLRSDHAINNLELVQLKQALSQRAYLKKDYPLTPALFTNQRHDQEVQSFVSQAIEQLPMDKKGQVAEVISDTRSELEKFEKIEKLLNWTLTPEEVLSLSDQKDAQLMQFFSKDIKDPLIKKAIAWRAKQSDSNLEQVNYFLAKQTDSFTNWFENEEMLKYLKEEICRGEEDCSLGQQIIDTVENGEADEFDQLLAFLAKLGNQMGTKINPHHSGPWFQISDGDAMGLKSLGRLKQNLAQLIENNPDCWIDQDWDTPVCTSSTLLGPREQGQQEEYTGLLKEIKPLTEKLNHRKIQDNEKILRLVNQQRKAAGLRPLILIEDLNQAARVQSENMSRNKTLAHNIGDSTLVKRVLATGYDYNRVSENIAEGTRSADRTVECWMASPNHRANILDPDVTHMGVGKYGKYWTQVFARGQPSK